LVYALDKVWSIAQGFAWTITLVFLEARMSMKLTSEEILEKVQKAFSPFHVVAELQDYHHKLGFRVYGENNEIIGTYEGSLIEDLRNPANLKQLIMDTRAHIQRSGGRLNSWSFES
jgi:hypothetical protein